MYTLDDVDSFGISIEFSKDSHDSLLNTLNELSLSKFTRGTVKATTVASFFDKNIPVLTLTGNGYEIAVTNTRIVVLFLDARAEIINIDSDDSEDEEVDNKRLFSQEYLSSIDVDVNFVIGLILGKLGLKLSSLRTVVKMSLSQEGQLKNDFTNMLSSESKMLFDKTSDLHFNGITFSTNEESGNEKTHITYSIVNNVDVLDKEKSVRSSITVESKLAGSLNIYTLLENSLSRINKVILSLSGEIVKV